VRSGFLILFGVIAHYCFVLDIPAILFTHTTYRCEPITPRLVEEIRVTTAVDWENAINIR
jgi:hypothetical protein